MQPTPEMIQAEREREGALDKAHLLLDIAKQPTCNGFRADEWRVDEAIRNLMIGSHAGRIGYDAAG